MSKFPDFKEISLKVEKLLSVCQNHDSAIFSNFAVLQDKNLFTKLIIPGMANGAINAIWKKSGIVNYRVKERI